MSAGLNPKRAFVALFFRPLPQLLAKKHAEQVSDAHAGDEVAGFADPAFGFVIAVQRMIKSQFHKLSRRNWPLPGNGLGDNRLQSAILALHDSAFDNRFDPQAKASIYSTESQLRLFFADKNKKKWRASFLRKHKPFWHKKDRKKSKNND